MIYLLDKSERLIHILPRDDLTEFVYQAETNRFDEVTIELEPTVTLDIWSRAVYLGFFHRHQFHVMKIVENVVDDQRVIKARDRAESDLRTIAVIKDKRPQNVTADQALAVALEGTGYQVGNVTGLPKLDSISFYYISPLEALVKIVEKWDCEFEVRYTFVENRVTGRYIDLYKRQGKATGRQFIYGDNALSIAYEEDSDDVITALIGRGKGEVTDKGGYGRRLEFTDTVWTRASGKPIDKPAGQNYVVDEVAREAFGLSQDGALKHRWGVYVNEEIEDPAVLLERTYEELKRLSVPLTVYKASILAIGESCWKGDTVAIIRDEVKIAFEARIQKVTVDMLDNESSEVVLGDYQALQNSQRRLEVSKTKEAVDQTLRHYDEGLQAFLNRVEEEKIRRNAEIDEQFRLSKLEMDNAILLAEQRASEKADAIKRSLSAQLEEAEQQFLGENQAQNAQLEAVRRQAGVNQNLAEEAKRLGNQAKTEASNALSRASQLKTEAVAEATRLLTVERQAIDTKLATAKSQAITEAGRLVDAAKTLLDGQMTNLSTDLARTKEDIKLLASKTDLNALTGRLSSAEATIRLQADQILQRVKTVDLDQAKQRIFTAETAINQMGNRITTEISEVTTKVDKLGFGSRNYVEDYDFSRGLWEYSQGDNSARNWSVENGVYTLTTTTGTWHQFQIHSESGRRLGGKKDSTALLELAVGETYTLSVEVKRNSGSGRFWVEVRDNGMANYNNVVVHVSNFSNSPTATSEWQRYSYTFTCKAKSDFSHRRVILGYNEIGSISFRKVELTQGTKFSDAGPAPEDTQTDISAVKTIITKTAEGVEQLSTKQVQTDGKLTNVETQIRQLIGDVSSKVSQTDFDTVKRTVQHQETKIAQNNQSILLKADKQTVEGVKSQAEEALAKAQSNATTISRATAQLQVVADAVETKATKTDLNNLTGRMTNAETTIRTQAGQIEQRLTRSQVDQLVDGKGLATTNLVRETAESFSRTLTQVENKIPTEIGARNYIQDFGFAENHTFYNNSSLWNYERIADPTARSGYHIKATCTRAGSGGFYRMLFDLRGAEWQGRIMTYSVDIKCSKNVRMRLGPEAFENYGTQTMDVGTTWKRFVSSRTVRFVTYYSFRFYTGNTQWAIGDVIYLRDPQLEDGALATTPRPALEDLATVTALHEVRDTVSSHTRTISEQGRSISQAIQTANGILVRVGSLENTTATKSALTAVQTEVSQLAGSWAVRNLTNAGTILNQINLLANGNNRIDGRLTHITGQTLIDNGVIKTAMIYSLDAGKITSGYIASERFQANSITGAHIVADQALFNKLGANEAYLKQLFAKQAFLTSVQAVDLSANRIKGGMLASLNGATAFNMSSGALDFYTDNPALRRVLNGYPTQFLRFTTGNSSGNKVGVTILGSNRRGSETSNDGGFVGIRAWNGANDDKLDLVGDTIRLASSAFNDADGWTLNTLPGNLTLEAFRPADRLSSKMKVGDIFLWRTETSYNSLKNIINSIIENIRLLHANKSTQNSYTYNLPIKF